MGLTLRNLFEGKQTMNGKQGIFITVLILIGIFIINLFIVPDIAIFIFGIVFGAILLILFCVLIIGLLVWIYEELGY